MLVRTYNNKLVEIKRENFKSDTEFYQSLYSLKFNKKFIRKNDCVENIISLIVYEDR